MALKVSKQKLAKREEVNSSSPFLYVVVFDPAHYSTSTHAHHFLHLLILSLQHPQDPLGPTPPEEDTVVPFQFQLPLDLGSSYKDKKASVQYTLQW